MLSGALQRNMIYDGETPYVRPSSELGGKK